jgi:DNA-binding CsgD family transcriptional regulator
MEHLFELIQQRQSPGILIFNFQGRLCYSNKEALTLIPNLQQTDSESKTHYHIPAEIKNVCTLAKGLPVENEAVFSLNGGTYCAIMVDENKQVFSLRASLIDSLRSRGKYGYIIVLIERVVGKHIYNFDKIKERYFLSAREVDVIKKLSRGLSNKNIAEKLFISEYTVKVHLKHIMAKMGTKSRNAIIALLLDQQFS